MTNILVYDTFCSTGWGGGEGGGAGGEGGGWVTPRNSGLFSS